MPRALILSSCIGGHRGIAGAFKERSRRPEVIFGAEAKDDEHLLTFSGACISWPILYTVLATVGMNPEAFKDAVNKMNHITPHQFVYRRWDEEQYRRYPSRRPGRPAGFGRANGRKRHLSAAARKRIGEAMKKRWAERKKKAA
jgi:hypothetical protein